MKDCLCVFTAILIWCAVMPMALRSGGHALAETGGGAAFNQPGEDAGTDAYNAASAEGECPVMSPEDGSPADGAPIYINVCDSETGQVGRHELELYTARAIGALMEEGTPAEALKAQAVALRSVVCFRHENPCHDGYELCTDEKHCFALPEKARADCLAAAEATKGLILTYGGRAALALSHVSSCVKTESHAAVYGEAIPYLIPVSVPDGGGFRNHRTVKSLSLREYEDAFAGYKVRFDSAARVGKTVFTEGGRVRTIEAGGLCFKGSTFARLFGLPSTCFTAEQGAGRVTLSCCGSGDGVGMSRLSAALMAEKGADFRAILQHFFPNTELSRICTE